ncbi:type VI secretion protein [Acinetobacter sp. Ac_877]|uniref:type VI secretion system baseplate subunit TssG n=1 Tax=Acinetobacter portensis TaxID=1839785 RepID=UPI00128E0284|nr:type VI secretion system baseplate subunit TssG [Acinetobacter portensis]MPW40797.1 type VI secretion protein [Acinetobacter portensis]
MSPLQPIVQYSDFYTESKVSQIHLFAFIRGVESLCDFKYGIGDEIRFADTSVRFKQTAFLNFPNKQINSINIKDGVLNVDVKGFGLFGPNGSLPIHITEMIYERKIHQKDTLFNDFVDIFHNRLISLFYKAWRDAQDITSLENKDAWKFSKYIASILGIENQKESKRSLHHYDQFYNSSLLLNKNMPLENFKAILTNFFETDVEIEEYIGQWIDASAFSITLENKNQVTLGQGFLVGDKIFDITQKIRLVIGPIDLQKYLKFIRGQKFANQLIEWVGQYTRHQLDWDVDFIVDYKTIPVSSLSGGVSLGLTSWLGQNNKNPVVRIKY